MAHGDTAAVHQEASGRNGGVHPAGSSPPDRVGNRTRFSLELRPTGVQLLGNQGPLAEPEEIILPITARSINHRASWGQQRDPVGGLGHGGRVDAADVVSVGRQIKKTSVWEDLGMEMAGFAAGQIRERRRRPA